MNVDDVTMATVDDPTTVIAGHLREGDELIRCAAAKALGTLGGKRAAPALVEALLDQDPDLRTDAMEALAGCARPEDAEAISRSLQGDPVKEVKVFAIEALARLEDRAALPLLRALAKDRAGDEVAWEDEAGMWDDWLDVQVAAIKALGRMQVSEAIDDLLDARTDEMGQELDIVVFATLAEMQDGGLLALFALLRDHDPRVRERALRALSKARPEAMLPMQAILLRDANPRVRQLAIGTLATDSQAAADLVLNDPDAGVRKAALAAFASARPDLAMAALRDRDEDVLAVAVQSLPVDIEPTEADDLAANLQAWMESAGPPLTVAAAKALPKFADRQAHDALCRLATNTARPTEARIAALQTLGELTSETVIKTLGGSVEDPARQIRTMALAVLADIAGRQDDRHQRAAEAILVAAIRGELGADAPVAAGDGPEGADDIGASKTEDAPGHITISPDGEIVTLDESADDNEPVDDNAIEGHFPTSTLDAIQTVSTSGQSVDDTELPAVGGQRARRRRVAVDGPDDVKQDIRVVALGMIADCSGQQIDQALLDTLVSQDQVIRLAAFNAIGQRSETGPEAEALIKACQFALADPDAAIRAHAATFIGQNSNDAPNLLSTLIADPDPIVRTTALKALARTDPEQALNGLRDPSALVRRAAMQLLLASADKMALEQGIDLCLMEELADVLTEGCKHCTDFREKLLASISKDKLTNRQLRIALEAWASA